MGVGAERGICPECNKHQAEAQAGVEDDGVRHVDEDFDSYC